MSIFLDAGFYVGNALKKYVDNGTVDNSWTVYAFEPNPEINAEEQAQRFDVPIMVIRKAVWTKDGYKMFQISTKRTDASSIVGMANPTDSRFIRVKTIDFSKFVKELPEQRIICSMDIEGAEFPVLERMLAQQTIDKIELLDIEFHHRLMLDKTKDDAQNLINQIESRGVKVCLKIPLE